MTTYSACICVHLLTACICAHLPQLISRVIDALDDGALLKPPSMSCISTSPSSSSQQLAEHGPASSSPSAASPPAAGAPRAASPAAADDLCAHARRTQMQMCMQDLHVCV